MLNLHLLAKTDIRLNTNFYDKQKSLPVFPQRGISFLFSKQIAVFEICEECKDIVTSLGGVDLVLVGHGGGQLIKSLRRLHTLPQELADGVEDNYLPSRADGHGSSAARRTRGRIHEPNPV